MRDSMLLDRKPGVAVKFASAYSLVRVFRFDLFYGLVFPLRKQRFCANARARAGAGARADAELRFGRNDAPCAFHSAGALSEPIDTPHRAIGRNVFVAKKELKCQRENDDNSSQKEYGLNP
jgi:hypothetical protein